MFRRLFAATTAILMMSAGSTVLACDADARGKTAQAIQSMSGGSNLDSAQLELALLDLCGARDQAAVRGQKEDQLEWRPVVAAEGDVAPAKNESGAEAREDEPETTTILGMEFRKADPDSEGRRRLMKKR